MNHARFVFLSDCRIRSLQVFAAIALLVLSCQRGYAQTGTVSLDMSALDGVALTPDNIAAISIQSSLPSATQAQFSGSVRYHTGTNSFQYSFRTTLRPGVNRIDPRSVRVEYRQFSSSALKELFLNYKTLPQGAYQNCIKVQPVSASGEQIAEAADEQCLVQKSDELFLINLVDPDNNAKIHERNPVLSWIVNYPFASQLTYRIRVAEIKQGQNNVAAITRNNPVYAESNLPQTTTTYPVYARLLELFQPYAWTVDAYFKGILLGGAEPWRFTIVEDSMMKGIPSVTSDIDIVKEEGRGQFYAIGELKLKYVVEDMEQDSLQIHVIDDKGKDVKYPVAALYARYGDNRYAVDFREKVSLKHFHNYTIELTSATGKVYSVLFKYINPDFI